MRVDDSLSNELKNLGEKRARTSWCLLDNTVDGRLGNFLYCKSEIDCFGRNCNLNPGDKNEFLQIGYH